MLVNVRSCTQCTIIRKITLIRKTIRLSGHKSFNHHRSFLHKNLSLVYWLILQKREHYCPETDIRVYYLNNRP